MNTTCGIFKLFKAYRFDRWDLKYLIHSRIFRHIIYKAYLVIFSGCTAFVIVIVRQQADLMLFLLKNPGKVFSREKLLDLVWGYDYLGDTRTVDVHIRRLREKLEMNPAQPEHIITKWGVGYYLAE